MSYSEEIALAKTRAGSLEDHLWYLALAVGPDDPERGMWEAADGTPVDVVRHITELSEGLIALRKQIRALKLRFYNFDF